MRIKVLGAGSWGTALSLLLCANGHTVSLWSRKQDQVTQILATRENAAFLPGILLPDELIVTDQLSDIGGYQMVVLAVPSNAIHDVCKRIKPYIQPGTIIVNTAKGFELDTQKRLSEVIIGELPESGIVTLSGPSHAEEVARQLTTTIVAAGLNIEHNTLVQDVFMNNVFRVYTNTDLIGVEIGGAVKNVIAIGTGISEGIGLGDNGKAALITRGLAEITRLGIAMGAKLETFIGLAGIGDLVVTCGSEHSRNRRAGIEIGLGKPVDEVLKTMGMVVEGFYATDNTYQLAAKYNIKMPITEQIYKVLYRKLSPKEALFNLMTRDKASEHLHR